MRAVRKLGATALVTAVAAALVVGTAGQASADGLCLTNSDTPVYEHSGSGGQLAGYLFTLSPGRDFAWSRYEEGGVDTTVTYGHYVGHGAEHPNHDGYVDARRISC